MMSGIKEHDENWCRTIISVDSRYGDEGDIFELRLEVSMYLQLIFEGVTRYEIEGCNYGSETYHTWCKPPQPRKV